jgi:hypothetical protein
MVITSQATRLDKYCTALAEARGAGHAATLFIAPPWEDFARATKP